MLKLTKFGRDMTLLILLIVAVVLLSMCTTGCASSSNKQAFQVLHDHYKGPYIKLKAHYDELHNEQRGPTDAEWRATNQDFSLFERDVADFAAGMDDESLGLKLMRVVADAANQGAWADILLGSDTEAGGTFPELQQRVLANSARLDIYEKELNEFRATMKMLNELLEKRAPEK